MTESISYIAFPVATTSVAIIVVAPVVSADAIPYFQTDENV